MQPEEVLCFMIKQTGVITIGPAGKCVTYALLRFLFATFHSYFHQREKRERGTSCECDQCGIVKILGRLNQNAIKPKSTLGQP